MNYETITLLNKYSFNISKLDISNSNIKDILNLSNFDKIKKLNTMKKFDEESIKYEKMLNKR